MDHILNEDQLPIKMAGFGHCFRTEAGAGGELAQLSSYTAIVSGARLAASCHADVGSIANVRWCLFVLFMALPWLLASFPTPLPHMAAHTLSVTGKLAPFCSLYMLITFFSSALLHMLSLSPH